MDRLFKILEFRQKDDKVSRLVSAFLMCLIALNVIAVILQTVKSIGQTFPEFFWLFEVFSVSVFTIEYSLRLITHSKRVDEESRGKLAYILSPMLLIDLLAILPFYLPFLIVVDLRFIRAIRLLRLTRLFKLGRYTESLLILRRAIRSRREELLICLFAALILLVIASGCLYFLERDVQPEQFSSIPASMWWGVATLTTVGYGDVYPITPWGRVLGAIIALLGVGLFALPAGIIASGFSDALKERQGNKCPHCGKLL